MGKELELNQTGWGTVSLCSFTWACLGHPCGGNSRAQHIFPEPLAPMPSTLAASAQDHSKVTCFTAQDFI